VDGQRETIYVITVGITSKAGGNNIKSGEPCIAYSIYTDRTPYYEWEGEFIDLAKMKEGG
jgi:hypothetical protein